VPATVALSHVSDERFLSPSPLTRPDDRLRQAARELRDGPGGRSLGERICAWTNSALFYDGDATDVWTTAADALALGRGVCQDYAHVMLALCRLCLLPARYVSGHLRGEGGTHAWVEVLVAADGTAGGAEAMALDPTHARTPGVGYVTVAVGRDYGDVAPTSGTYDAPWPGRLSIRKRLTEDDLELSAT
jgi:transglutaminase-like putative cysteine protease